MWHSAEQARQRASALKFISHCRKQICTGSQHNSQPCLQESLAAGEGAVHQAKLQQRSVTCTRQLQAAEQALQEHSAALKAAQADVHAQKLAVERHLSDEVGFAPRKPAMM